MYLVLQGRGGKALIVGGGVGGLAAGIALQQAGFEVVIFEKTTEPPTSGAGLWLWPNAVAALDALGVADRVRGVSVAHPRVQVRSAQGRDLFTMGGTDLPGAPIANLTVHRPELAAALSESLAPGAIRRGTRVVGAHQDAKGASVTLEGGRSVHGDVVIGADGLMSGLRTQFFDDRPLRDAGFTAFRAVIEMPDAPAGGVMTWGCAARFGFMPLTRGRVNWFAALNVQPDDVGAGHELKKGLLARFAGWPVPIEAAIDRTDPDAILVHRVFDRRPLPRWNLGRIALLGDAAHPMTPSLGQGACQAFEDAVALGRALATEPDVFAALHLYDRVRRHRAHVIAARSRRLDALIQLRWRHGCSIRDFVYASLPETLTTRLATSSWSASGAEG